MSQKQKNCFVLMPFAEEYKEIYDQVYKPVCESNDLKCWRVDEIARPGSITQDIVEGIIGADIIIADLTTKNANVFYELGIAHTIGAKVIMTCQNGQQIPFDIANYRVIFYEQTISGSKQLSEKLNKAIKELFVAFDLVFNPVQAVLSDFPLVKSKRQVPIARILNFRGLTNRVRTMLENEKIIYADDLKKINLEEIKGKYKLGETSLEQLVFVILKHELYEDLNAIQNFIIKYKLDLSENWRTKDFIINY